MILTRLTPDRIRAEFAKGKMDKHGLPTCGKRIDDQITSMLVRNEDSDDGTPGEPLAPQAKKVIDVWYDCRQQAMQGISRKARTHTRGSERKIISEWGDKMIHLYFEEGVDVCGLSERYGISFERVANHINNEIRRREREGIEVPEVRRLRRRF